ncbi:MAG: hypothetical protein HXS52_12325 [Theionarchaea archaeon]|nr:hypothetical protein [Theionarchaea archaeon]MBU7038709.1 hypothetical protein [Theionarchaea archaeon]
MKKNQTNRKRVTYSLSLIALLLVSGVTVASESDLEDLPALVLLDGEGPEIDTVCDLIRDLDGEVMHVFPPEVIIGKLSVEAEETLIEDPSISVYRGPVDTEGKEWPEDVLYPVTAWNYNYMGLSVDAGLNEPPLSPEPPPDDCELLPDISSYLMPSQYDGALPYGAGFQDTSAYLAGTVAVSVLFLESNGTIDDDTENWTEEEQVNVVSEIQNGLNWLLMQEPAAQLSFVYEWHFNVPVGYEPITRPHTDDDLWEEQAMHHLGYGSPNYVVNEYSYVNDLRNTYDSDWAFIIFVVDDSEDEDNAFADGYSAYSFLGGPRVVITYSNSIWGIANMDTVIAHEICHVFWALDQACTSEVEQSTASGYLGGETTNSEWNGTACTSTVSSLMKGERMLDTQIEVSARTQLGWSDSDSDGILDVFDTVPAITLTQQDTSWAGTAKESPLPNQNPLTGETDISLNTISDVQYRVDQGEWEQATPSDGSFDEPEEEFTLDFGTTDMADGDHTLDVKTQNSVGNWSQTESVTFTVGESEDDEQEADDNQADDEPGTAEPSEQDDQPLHCDISTNRSEAGQGDEITVIMTVTNTMEALAKSVVPTLVAPDAVTLISGPEPETQDIPGGESAAFVWEYEVTAEESTSLIFTGSAAGAEDTGAEIESSEAESGTVTVTIEPDVPGNISALLYGVIEGSTITMTMEVYNTGEVTLEDVTPSTLSTSTTGTAAASLVIGPLPKPPISLEPGETKTFEWKYAATPGTQGGTVVFTGYVSGEAEGQVFVSSTAMSTVGVASPAILTAFVIVTPREVAEGDLLTVAMTVQNIGQAEAVNVVPSELTVSGTGAVELVSGPSRTSISVPSHSFEIILWTYVAVKQGTVVFSGTAQGVDTSTGDVLTVPEQKSNTLTITEGQQSSDNQDQDQDDQDQNDQDQDQDDQDQNDQDQDQDDQDQDDQSESPKLSSECSKVERTIQKVKNLLYETRTKLEEKKKQNWDVRLCEKLLREAEMYIDQAELYFEMGKCKEASTKAIQALMKVYEVLSCLGRI